MGELMHKIVYEKKPSAMVVDNFIVSRKNKIESFITYIS